jgi:hypothetical protein
MRNCQELKVKGPLSILIMLFVGTNAFGQPCPNGYCPEPQKPSEAAQAAIQDAAYNTFSDVKDVSFDVVSAREAYANLADNVAATVVRSDLSYEHVGVKIQLMNGTILHCNRAVVIKDSNNFRSVDFRSCKVN